MPHRVWRANGLKPHLARTFKLSNDPRFVEKLIDVVGLYLDPPERALVFCVDQKSRIQALDRTQPGLPLKIAPAAKTPGPPPWRAYLARQSPAPGIGSGTRAKESRNTWRRRA